MYVNVGDKVLIGFNDGERYIGEVVRCYKEIDLAIVEYDTPEGKRTVKTHISDIVKYHEPIPKKERFIDKVKSKLWRIDVG